MHYLLQRQAYGEHYVIVKVTIGLIKVHIGCSSSEVKAGGVTASEYLQ